MASVPPVPALVLGTAGVWLLFVIASRAGFIPIWDGRVYADCIIGAATRPSLASLRCGLHASQAYVAVAAALQALAPDSFLPMLIGNTLLAFAAVVAFYKISARAFPDTDLTVDRALLTATFALQPSVMGALLQPGLDLPLLPLFLWCLLLLLSGRRAALVAAGVALCFTKETGVLLYAVLIGCYGVWLMRRANWAGDPSVSRRSRLGLLALPLPLLAFATYLAVRAMAPKVTGPVLWSVSSTNESLLHQFIVPRVDLHLIKYLALLFVLSFAWVPAVTLAVDAFVGAVRTGHRLTSRSLPGADPRIVTLLVLLTIATTYSLTRFTTFGHVRYFLTAVPLVLLIWHASLVRLHVPTSARRAVLAAYALVLGASQIRTIDPVSKAVYGTFPVGTHRMLRMTSITGECCGAGQDQLAYSAEFTVLHDLVDSTLVAMPHGEPATVVLPDSLDWIWVVQLDSLTGLRTLARHAVLQPRVIEHWKIIAGREPPPARATFIALPTGNVARALEQLARLYVIHDRRRFAAHGYAIESYSLTLRTDRR